MLPTRCTQSQFISSEMVLWCNTFSLLIGAEPCYYIEKDGGAKELLNPENLRNEIHFEPHANGVALPNGSEWEYAAGEV